MEFSLDIEESAIPKPRLLLYGPAGVGKTSFGRSCENPVMILTEDGCPHGVPKLPSKGKLDQWGDVLGAVPVGRQRQSSIPSAA